VFEAAKLAAKERAATVGGEFAQAKERRPGLLNQRTVALHERTRPGQPQVIGNKGGVGNGVAVEEHEVGAGGPGDGEVKDARAAEAGVLLPNPGARERLPGRPGFKGSAGSRCANPSICASVSSLEPSFTSTISYLLPRASATALTRRQVSGSTALSL
jgi:hypothetical protein